MRCHFKLLSLEVLSTLLYGVCAYRIFPGLRTFLTVSLDNKLFNTFEKELIFLGVNLILLTLSKFRYLLNIALLCNIKQIIICLISQQNIFQYKAYLK